MAIEHAGWRAVETDERDGDGFVTPHWHAERAGETRTLHHSRFDFEMTPARFGFLVGNDFPQHRGVGPWTSAEIDAAIADSASEGAGQ